MSRRGGKVAEFAAQETVLCLSRGSYYEAKIIRTQMRDDDTPTYRVHYIGWSSAYAKRANARPRGRSRRPRCSRHECGRGASTRPPHVQMG